MTTRRNIPIPSANAIRRTPAHCIWNYWKPFVGCLLTSFKTDRLQVFDEFEPLEIARGA